MITYRITPAQVAAAEQAAQDFTILSADHPHAKAPQSFRQMILNERHGWVCDFATGQYKPEDGAVRASQNK